MKVVGLKKNKERLLIIFDEEPFNVLFLRLLSRLRCHYSINKSWSVYHCHLCRTRCLHIAY